MSIKNIKPEPVVLDVYVLNHFTVNGQLVSSTVYATYEKALRKAVNTARAFIPNLVLHEVEVSSLLKLVEDPSDYGDFLSQYRQITGDEFRIGATTLEL